MMKPILLIMIVLGLLPMPLLAVVADGNFTVTRSCPAYVSKNKQTNPDGALVAPGVSYPLLEANQPTSPTWYRVRVAGVNPPERWVAAECGILAATAPHRDTAQGLVSSPPTTRGTASGDAMVSLAGGGGNACHIAGLADGYILAVSWQPAFCETHHGSHNPECNQVSVSATHNFTLHGLWPNRSQCGTEYAFCGAETVPKPFCSYPALPLTTAVQQALGEIMPSATAGSCLQRYEWYKHGVCQKVWDVNAYFATAITLVRQFNESGVGAFMAHHLGEVVATKVFLDEIDHDLGSGAHERLKLTCYGGNLTDIFIALPATIAGTPNLGQLLKQARPDFRSNCGASFRVDAVH